MKFYPFFKSHEENENALCCFRSYLWYHGYQMDMESLRWVFSQKKHGISWSSFLAGLDYFQVIYEILYYKDALSSKMEGMILKHRQQYMLCLGQCHGYVLVMCPWQGYRFIKKEEMQDWSIEACLQLKFLGAFPYFKKSEITRSFRKWFFVFLFIQLLIVFLPFSSVKLNFIGEMVNQVVFLRLVKRFCYQKDMRRFQEKGILAEGLKEYQNMIRLDVSNYATALLLLGISVNLVLQMGLFYSFLSIFLILFDCLMVYRHYHESVILSVYTFLLITVGPVFSFLKILILDDYYFYCCLSFLHLFLLIQLLTNQQKWSRLSLDCLSRWYQTVFLEESPFSRIDSLGFDHYLFEESTLILGSEKERRHFFNSLKGPQLRINEMLLKKQGLIFYLKDIIYLENLLYLDSGYLLEELFKGREDQVLKLLEELDCFDYCIYFKYLFQDLDKSVQEIFGFIDLMTKPFTFAIIEEAFIYQTPQSIEKCLKIIAKNNEVKKIIIAIPTIKLMNQENICAIIKHEKVR